MKITKEFKLADLIFKISPNIILGSYVTSRLGQYAGEWGSKFMLIVDPILKESNTSQKVSQALSDRKIDFFTFDEISMLADTEVLSVALRLARDACVHGVIACGGARTLALAKAVCALYHETHDLYDFVDGCNPSVAPLPLICLPSTMRDVFLFTDRTPVVDARSSKISLIKTQNGLCKSVIWDPALSVGLTEKQNSSMTLETLSLAIESYMSQKSTFFSDMLIEKSLELLSYGMDGSPSLTITTPKELLLTQGGCMASLGAASSSLGACSLISLSVNSRFNISRSLTSSILLPYIIEDGAKFQASRLAKIAKILKTCEKDASDIDAAASLAESIRTRIAQVNLPSRLKDLSLSIEQLSLAVEDCGTLDLINSLPRSMTTDDLFEIVKQAY